MSRMASPSMPLSKNVSVLEPHPKAQSLERNSDADKDFRLPAAV